MIDQLIRAYPDQSLQEVAQILAENNLRYLVVIESNKPTGIVSDRDVIKGIASGVNHLKVRDIMSQASESIGSEEDSIFYLRDQDISFRSIIENCHDIFILLDRSGKFIYCSPSATKILGFVPSDILSRSIFEFINPEDIDTIVDSLETSLRETKQASTRIEFRMISYQNKYRYFDGSITNLLNHPAIQAVVFILRDITDRKALETQRIEDNQKNKIIAELIQMLHQSLDLSDIFTITTTRLRELIGVDRVEITQFYADLNYWEPICESRSNNTIPSVLGTKISAINNPISDRLIKGETVKVNDASSLEDETNQNLAEEFPGAWLAVPISVKNKVWGVVSLDFHHQYYEWQTEDIEIAELAVKQIAIAIERSQLFQQITIEQQALAESEERLRLALEFSNVGCWEFSFATGEAIWSESHYHLMGLDPKDVKPAYHTWKERVHPDDLPWVEERFNEAVNQKTNLNIVYRIVQPSGSVQWVLTKGKAIYRDEKPEKMLGVMMDITDRKDLELSLAQKEEQLSLVLKLNKVGVWDWDLTTGHVEWSKEKYELLGLDPDSPASYDAFMNLVVPEQQFEIEEQIKKCLTNHDTYCHETKIITPQGQERWLKEQAKCEVKDNQVVRMLGITQDISLRKQAEIKLVESEERYRNITENISGVVMRYSLNKRGQEKIIYASNRSIEIFEISSEDLVNDNNLFWNLMSEEELNLFHSSILHSAQHKQKWHREFQIVTPINNLRKWIYGVGNPIMENGNVYWDMIMVDITDQKSIESALKQEQEFTQQITLLTSAIIYIYNTVNDSVRLLNYELANILDIEAEKIQPYDYLFQTLIHPNDLDLVRKHWLSLSGNAIQEIEFRIIDRLGNWHWLISRDRVFKYDQDGNPKEILGVAIDITNQKQIESALRDSESRFKHLVANIPGIVLRYLIHPNGTDQILYISPSCYQIFEKTDQEILENDRLFWGRVLAEDLPSLYSSFLISSQNLSQWKRLWRIRTTKGIRWLSGVGSPELLTNGDVVWDAIILDVTAQKEAELQQQKQEEIIKQVAESASVLIYVYDLEENCNIYVNPEIESLLGYSPQEVQAMGKQLFIELAHPDDLPHIQTSLQNMLQAKENELFEIEYRLKDKQGNWHWLISRDRIIERNKLGLPKRILGVATDITKLKLAENLLQQINQELEQRIKDRTHTLEEQLEQELLLRTILQNIHHSLDIEEIFYTVTNETRFTFAADRVAIYQFNQSGGGSFVWDAYDSGFDSIKGKDYLEDIFLAQLKEGSLDNPHVFVVNDVFASVGYEVNLLPELPVFASLSTPIYLKDKDRLWGAIVIYEHHQTREWELWEVNLIQQIGIQIAIAIQQCDLYTKLSSELNQKNILLKEVHHRVKNNLQIMSSLLRMQFRKVDPEIKEMVENYQTRLQAMALVHDQLYSHDNFAQINLQNYFNKLTNYLLQTYLSDGDKIEFFIETNDISLPLEKLIPLGLATSELLTNALKYAFPDRGGTIKLTIEKQAKMLELEVSDNGVGLPSDLDVFNSSGLGMQLVTTLVEQLEGDLRYENCNGSTFRITFPL